MSKPFFDQVRQLRKGQFLVDCGEALREVKQYVDETRKPGKLVIELTVKPAGKGQGVYVLADKVEAKLPKRTQGETIMFGTPEDNFVCDNPDQGALPLREVPAPGTTSANLKQAGGEG